MIFTGLHNLGTISQDAEKDESSRLSTPVEKAVDNSKAALGADSTHRALDRSISFKKLDRWTGCG